MEQLEAVRNMTALPRESELEDDGETVTYNPSRAPQPIWRESGNPYIREMIPGAVACSERPRDAEPARGASRKRKLADSPVDKRAVSFRTNF